MAGCRSKMKVFVQRGYGYKEITVRCGNTSPDGSPFLCDKCEVEYADTNWRQEAIDAGENWDEDDY